MTSLIFIPPGGAQIMADSSLEDVIINFEEIRLPWIHYHQVGL